MAGDYAIGLDLGGTTARAAAVDEHGRLLAVHKEPVTDRSPEACARLLTAGVQAVMSNAGRPESDCVGVGIGLPGQVDSRTGHVVVAPNLGWRDVEFGPLMTLALGRAVHLANDLAAAALGEASAGAAKGFRDAVLVFVGSGVGAGFVLDGRMYRGARGVGGELGHVKVRPGGRKCGCGELGCLEAYAGGHNLGARAVEAIADGRQSSLVFPAGLRPTMSMLEAAADEGDPLSRELRDDAGNLVGVAAANVVTLLNPSVLILGGGVLGASPTMRRQVENVVRANASRASIAELLIVTPALGDDAGVIGAAFLARA